jgi:RNA polymerase-binding transcription factor DksA
MQQYNPEQVTKILHARRSQLLDRRQRVDRDLGRRNEPLALDSGDRATQLENDAALQEIGAVAAEEIAAIDVALNRLSLGLYGKCSACGRDIGASRLQALPHAVTCAGCARR